MTITRRFGWRLGAGLVFAAALAGCNDENYDPILVANPDSFTLQAGQTASVLGNDTYDGAAATAGAAGNVTFTVTGTLPAGVSANNGVFSVGTSAVPGSYTIGYRICQNNRTDNCATANATLTIPAPAIVATADSFTLVAGGSADVLANDTLAGAPATAALVTVTATGTLPTGIMLSAGGVVSVSSAATAGVYALPYRICQTVASSNCATATATVTVPAGASISGRAIDAATAAGVANVRVSAGGLSTTTDATGAFVLPGLTPAARTTVVFTSPTHAEAVRIAEVGPSGSTDVQARLVRLGASTDVDVATGGTVTVSGSSAQVVIPPDAVERADGSVPTGNMRVHLTAFDPASDTSVMPGDFTTLVGGTSTPIESFGAINVELADAAGVALNLREGQTATIRIPLSSRNASAPFTVPLYYFDNGTGRWVEQGSATLAGSGTGRYYEGTVSHFTTWNADQVYNTAVITGCVADANGVRMANAHIFSDGVDYSGSSSATSDSAGSFSIPIRRGSIATLVAVSGGLLSNTLRAGPYNGDTTIDDCLALGQTGAGITMKLTWGQYPADLDSHLLAPNGAHVFYSDRGSLTNAPFANLDVDDTSSYGPEVVTLTRLMVGTYKYYVHNFSGYNNGAIGASSARVELNVPGRAAELFTPPTSGETVATVAWTLFEIDVDAQCNITVRRDSAYVSTQPTAATGTATYCMRP